MDNLNSQLQPINSPVAQNEGAANAYQFDSDNERNTVNLTKIKNFSFSSGTGGTLQLGGTNNGNGLLKIYDTSGSLAALGDNNGFGVVGPNSFYFVASDGTTRYAGFGADNASNVLFDAVVGVGFKVSASGAVFQMGAFSQGNFTVNAATATVNGRLVVNSGGAAVNGGFSADSIVTGGLMHSNNLQTDSNTILIGTAIKTAIVPTSKGYKALYCAESPDVWFFDFAQVKKSWKFWQKEYIIDPLFLEVTEKPYHFMPTLDRNIVQIWGKRKGFSKTRFESKTKTQFEKNNQFWATPQM